MMQKKSSRRFLSVLLSLALVFGIIPMTVLADDTDDQPVEPLPLVTYVDENGRTQQTQEYQYLTSEDVEWNSGTYVINTSLTYSERIKVRGSVTVLLTDQFVYDFYEGVSIYANYGIEVPQGSSLQIYLADTDHKSKMSSIYAYSSTPNQCAAIGGDAGCVNGDITLVGVALNLRGGIGAAAIGTGGCGTGNTCPDTAGYLSAQNAGVIRICNATISPALAGDYAASIGGGFHADSPDIYITDSTVGAYSSNPSITGASAIGGGYGGQCGTISISGGSVTAIASGDDTNLPRRGAAIGNGEACPSVDYSRCKISISNASITAISDIGSGLICSATDDPSLVPSNAVYIDPAMRIQIVENDAPNHMTDKYFTKDVNECVGHPHVYMSVCNHESASYECTAQEHLMVCPDCRTEFVYERHNFGAADNVCQDCGYGADAIIRSATAVFAGKLNMRYTFSFSSRLLEDEGAYVSFVSETTGNEIYRALIKDGTTVDGKIQIVYPFNITDVTEYTYISVHQGNGQKVTFHSGNGVDYTDKDWLYGPSAYATNVWNNTATTSEMRELAFAFYDYGVATKNALNKSGISQYISDFTGEEVEPFKPRFEGTRPDGIDRISLRMYFEDAHTLRVTFYFKEGVNPNDYVFMLDGEKVRAIRTSNGGYAVEVCDIAAPNLAYEYRFSIVPKGEQSGYTVIASGLSYAWTSFRTNDSFYIALAKYMYNYHVTAKAYFDMKDGQNG